ncbi:MAG TPA: SRPBCC family protein, partial [Pseudonocardiaceae bacterium]
MELENTFVVPVGVDRAWAALNDPERVAPCFPGATLESVQGDSFTGSVKLKLGPISMIYKGTGTFTERDEAARRVVIDATGRDSRGGGQAKARITGTLTPDGDSTSVHLVTDLAITGKPAQLGRGMIAEVSNKIVGQFASCLAETLGDAPAAAGTSTAPAASGAGGAPAASGAAPGAAGAA